MSLTQTDITTLVVGYLATRGFSLSTQALFQFVLPDAPINALVVSPTGGFVIAGNPFRVPTFTVQVRNTNVATALHVASTAYTALLNAWLPGVGRLVAQTEVGGYFSDQANNCIVPLNFGLQTVTPA